MKLEEALIFQNPKQYQDNDETARLLANDMDKLASYRDGIITGDTRGKFTKMVDSIKLWMTRVTK